jgi:hypothetical protein
MYAQAGYAVVYTIRYSSDCLSTLFNGLLFCALLPERTYTDKAGHLYLIGKALIAWLRLRMTV